MGVSSSDGSCLQERGLDEDCLRSLAPMKPVLRSDCESVLRLVGVGVLGSSFTSLSTSPDRGWECLRGETIGGGVPVGFGSDKLRAKE